MRIIAYQRREAERADYPRFIASIPRNMLLFIDETGKDISTLQVCPDNIIVLGQVKAWPLIVFPPKVAFHFQIGKSR